MPILDTDVKLMQSERLTDAVNGGGRMTSLEVPDNVAGNVFPKISRVDSTYGRVNLRKVYLAVRTALQELYSGAHIMLTDPPVDPKVQALLFSTDSSFDTRTEARDRIESYVVGGPESPYVLYGTQVVGQKSVKVHARPETPLPDVGDVYLLSVEIGSGAGTQQYVRIVDMDHAVGTFTVASGNNGVTRDIQRRVITLAISHPLDYTFVGTGITDLANHGSLTLVRETMVADAARYYGLRPLATAATTGALSVTVDDIYGQLVPSTRRETPVSLASISGSQRMAQSGSAFVDFVLASGLTTGNYELHLPTAVAPGTLMISVGSSSSVPFIDVSDNGDGTGQAAYASSGSSADAYVADVSINYAAGIVAFYLTTALPTMTWYASYTPAASVSQPSHTRQIPVTPATRGLVYTETLLPIPAPRGLTLDYLALGRWYRLTDDGNGQLLGADLSLGSGTIDYTTGSMVVTLGALPDVGSSILLSWGSPAHYAIRAGATQDMGATLDLGYVLANAPVVPGSVTLSYPVGGVSRDVTDDSAGNLSGTDVTGIIDYATGDVMLRFTGPPDQAALISNAYTWRDGTNLYNSVGTAAVANGSFTVPGTAPFRNGGTMTLTVTYAGVSRDVPAYISAAGQLRTRAGKLFDYNSRPFHVDDTAIGTFDTATGVVTITNQVVLVTSIWEPGALSWAQNWAYLVDVDGVHSILIERDTTAFNPMAVSGETVSPSGLGLTLDLTTTVGDSIVPGSVRFSAAGKDYIDRAGTLYADVSPSTGSGTVAGSVNYSSGICSVTWWADNVAANPGVRACLTQYGDWTAVDAYFRTAGSPLRAASLYVQVSATDGTLLTGVADANGVISGTKMRGEINDQMGVAWVEFGEMIGTTWTPTEVLPGTLRYSAIVLADLPLSADILGLDTVRLPSDGRVPIYRVADMVVIHHTAADILPNPAVAGATYSLSRSPVDYVEIVDQGGNRLPRTLYTEDLVNGQVTLANPLDLTGYTEPLIVRHRIEDMSLVADVQINGEITLAAALTHDYPATDTYCSSAILCGDLFAHVGVFFDQATWSSVWSDSLIGNGATANFNEIDYPLEVSNIGCITERWRIHFTSSTAFQVIGENLGIIATGDTSTDLQPINPVTGEAYFTLRAAGWGTGWSSGNQLRFNTLGANYPVWISRSILAGANRSGDRFELALRGDTDA